MELQTLRKRLPHGIIKKVAERLCLSNAAVSQALNGLSNTTRRAEILKTTAAILAEQKAEEQAALKAINEILQP